MRTGRRIALVLDELDDGVPWPIRLRALLKFALRFCRLKAVEVREAPGDARTMLEDATKTLEPTAGPPGGSDAAEGR